MEVTIWTWIIALAGIMIIGLLGSLEFIALLKPRSQWTIDNVYNGSPDATDPKAFFALNQGLAWVDVVFWAPLQVLASLGMILGAKWGVLLGLMASVPFWYTAVVLFVWDRDLGFRQNTLFYWIVVWGMFPAYGVIEGVYCFSRLL